MSASLYCPYRGTSLHSHLSSKCQWWTGYRSSAPISIEWVQSQRATAARLLSHLTSTTGLMRFLVSVRCTRGKSQFQSRWRNLQTTNSRRSPWKKSVGMELYFRTFPWFYFSIFLIIFVKWKWFIIICLEKTIEEVQRRRPRDYKPTFVRHEIYFNYVRECDLHPGLMVALYSVAFIITKDTGGTVAGLTCLCLTFLRKICFLDWGRCDICFLYWDEKAKNTDVRRMKCCGNVFHGDCIHEFIDRVSSANKT